MTLQYYRNKFLNITLLIIGFFLLIIIIYNFINYNHPPFSYVNYIMSFIYIACIFSFFLKTHVPYLLKAWLIIASIYFLILFNFFILGSTEFGVYNSIICVICCFIFLNLLDAFIFSTIILITFLITITFRLNNIITPFYTPEYMINSREFILERLFSVSFFIIFTASVLFYFFRYFDIILNSLKISNTELHNSNTALIEEIEKRKSTKISLNESRKRFENIVNAMSDWAWELNNKGEYTYVSANVYEHLGYKPEEMIGKSILQFVHPNDIIPSSNRINELLISKQPYSNFEITRIHKNGQQVILETSGIPIFDANRNFIGYRGVNKNITERKNTEKLILKAVIKSEEKQRNQFATELHDGLSPLLSTIKMYLQWFSKPESKADKSVLLNKAEETLDEAQKSIKEISNNMMPHTLNYFGLTKALKTFIEKLNILNIVSFDFISNLEERLKPEQEVALYRVLTECINNTLKHGDAKNITININKEENKLNISYTDDGKGFEADKASIYTSGTGLSNMQTRIKSIDGRLQISSQHGKGTVINIYIEI